MSPVPSSRVAFRPSQRGSVLIIVMLTCLGLVALALYFANSMSSELRAAGNRVDEAAAREAAAGGVRYAGYILQNYAVNGTVPDPTADYLSADLPVGDASFWFIGRDPNAIPTADPVFGLVDEASKLNLNTASSTMLLGLPGMTAELAQAIIDWRSPAGQAGGGAADNVYAALSPPRLNKGAPFETVDELRLVNGFTLDLLLGEDTNRNGALDPNEDDGDQSPPHDNQDGVLQPGFLEYVTVYSRQPNTRADGTPRVNITAVATRQGLSPLFQRRFGAARAATLIANIGTRNFASVAEFMSASQMTADEFQQVHTDVTATLGNYATGLVNINTACVAVLACLPGIGANNAASLVAYRTAHPEALTSFAWIAQVLTPQAIAVAGPFITDQSYQFTADVAAVGRLGRGYCREKAVFDTTAGTPRIIFFQDLGQYGWALGSQIRLTLQTAKDT